MFCKLVLPSNDIHKLPAVPETYAELHQIALRKVKAGTSDKFFFKYRDSDEDLITLSSDEDLKTAISTSEADNVKTLRIFLIPETGSPSPKDSLPPTDATLPPLSIIGRSSSFSRHPDDLENPDHMDLFRKSQTRTNVQDESGLEPRQSQFNRSEFLDGDHQTGDAMRLSTGAPFTLDQLQAISQLLERKLSEKLESRVQTIVNELMKKVNEDVRGKFPSFGPGSGMSQSQVSNQSRYSPYSQMPFMSKSVVPAFGMRNSQGRISTKKNSVEGNCTACGRLLENIRYICQECKDFELCENCEETVDHQHALLKLRSSRGMKSEQDTMDLSSVSGAAVSHGNASRYALNAGKTSSVSNSRLIESKQTSTSPDNRTHKMLRYVNTVSVLPYDIKQSDSVVTESQNKHDESEYSVNEQHERPSLPGGRRSGGKAMTTPGPFGTPGGEKEVKRYKGTVVKQTIYDLINVRPGQEYQVEFTIKNAGTENWPEDIMMVCINGVHKGHTQSLPALEAGKKSELKLVLKAPQTPGRYLSQWRLQYNEGGTPKPFGGNSFIEINVAEGPRRGDEKTTDKKEKENIKETKETKDTKENNISTSTTKEDNTSIFTEIKDWEEKIVQEVKERVKPVAVEVHKESKEKESVKPPLLEAKKTSDRNLFSEEENRLMKEMKCSPDVLKHAKQLHELYPEEDIRDQINFVEESPLYFDINEIVMLYCARMDTKAMNKGKKSLAQKNEEFSF